MIWILVAHLSGQVPMVQGQYPTQAACQTAQAALVVSQPAIISACQSHWTTTPRPQ